MIIWHIAKRKKISNKKSDRKYQQILLKPYREEAEEIRNAAIASDQSLQGYILQAIRERMARETLKKSVSESDTKA